jgi:polysaccharide pyruvyl transferase CsaB
MQAVHRSITASRENTEITVLSKNPKITREKYGFYAAARFNPFAVARAISRSDALVFGGGSLLQDNTSTRSLLYYLAVLKAARFFRKPVMIYANGIGPVNRPKNRRRVKRAVEGAAAVTLRDGRSLDELRSMGVTRSDIVITGDPVFTTELPPKAERDDILRAIGVGGAREFAAVCVRPWKQTPELAAELARFCDALTADLGVEIVFLPLQESTDAAFSREVAAKMNSAGRVPERELTPREVLAVLAEANFVVSMRLHALIFAARAGTPSLGIDVDPKLRVFLETLGMPNLGAPDAFRAEDALFRAIEVTQKRAELSAALNGLAAEQAELAKQDPIILKKLLDK